MADERKTLATASDLCAQTLSIHIRKRWIGAWLKALPVFPGWIDFSLLHILKVTLVGSLCHVAQSLFNPCCICTPVGHAVIRLTGMSSHFGGFVITCLLICEYSVSLCAKSGGHKLWATFIKDDLQVLCSLLSSAECYIWIILRETFRYRL